MTTDEKLDKTTNRLEEYHVDFCELAVYYCYIKKRKGCKK